MLDAFSKADRRLIFLDYDGTLVGFHKEPQKASPDKELLTIMKDLTDNPKNDVVIISGRDRHTLFRWLGKFPVGFITEHGVWLKEKTEQDWQMAAPLTDEWKTPGYGDA